LGGHFGKKTRERKDERKERSILEKSLQF